MAIILFIDPTSARKIMERSKNSKDLRLTGRRTIRWRTATCPCRPPILLAQHAAKWGLTTGWQDIDWSRCGGGRSRKLSTSYHVVTVKMEPVQKFLAGQTSCPVNFFFSMGTDLQTEGKCWPCIPTFPFRFDVTASSSSSPITALEDPE